MGNIFKELEELISEIQKNRENGKEDYDKFVIKYWKNPNKILPTILLGHIYIESCLDRLLIKALPKSDRIKSYNFSKKLEIIEALDILKPKILIKISLLNKLRNQLAHNLDFKMTLSQAKVFSDNPKDLSLYKVEPSEFMYLEITYIVGYLHAVISGQRRIKSLSWGGTDLVLIQNALKKK